MTHDYKSALDALEYIKDVLFNFKEHTDLELNLQFDTLRSALQLAQEAEQLKAQRVGLKANMDKFLEQEIMRTETVDGAICAFTIPRDELVEQLRKEREELAAAVLDMDVKMESYGIYTGRTQDVIELAKKVSENGNA